MSDKVSGKNKVGSVTSTSKTDAVEKAKAVTEASSVEAVGQVKATQAIGSVKATASVGLKRSTASMSLEERQQLLRMIDEETAKLEKSGLIPKGKKDIVQGSVSMTVKSLWAEDEENKE